MNSKPALLHSDSDSTVPQTLRRRWRLHLGLLAALLLVLGALFWPAVVAAVTVWWVSPTYSHCFLIIPVAAWLIWQRRTVLAEQSPEAYPRALILGVPILAALAVGTLADVNELEQLSLVALGEVAALAVLGPTVYRSVMFPALYLFFLVPVGGYLTTPLQSFTTHFVSMWLNWIGILHFTEGNVLQLPNGYFEVAEACAGLRFLIATIAVGVIFCYFTYRRWYKIGLFLAACVVVPVIGNGFRALGIVLLAYYSNNRIATGADHLIYGWVFSVLILFVLMAIGLRFADESAQDMPPPTPNPEAAGVAAHPSGALALTGVLALLMVTAVPAFLFWHDHRTPPVNISSFAAPIAAPGWLPAAADTGWRPLYAEGDATMRLSEKRQGEEGVVGIFVNYYAAQSRGRLVTSTNKMWDEDQWHPALQRDVHVKIAGNSTLWHELVIANPNDSRLIWWTYWSDGRFTTSGLAVKLDRLRTALSPGGGAALVAFTVPVTSDVPHAESRLSAAIGAFGQSVESRLVAASQAGN